MRRPRLSSEAFHVDSMEAQLYGCATWVLLRQQYASFLLSHFSTFSIVHLCTSLYETAAVVHFSVRHCFLYLKLPGIRRKSHTDERVIRSKSSTDHMRLTRRHTNKIKRQLQGKDMNRAALPTPASLLLFHPAAKPWCFRAQDIAGRIHYVSYRGG